MYVKISTGCTKRYYLYPRKGYFLYIRSYGICFYGYPSGKLRLVGVTGTNGKTTTASLLYQMFTTLGNSCGLLSVKYCVGNKIMDATHTTPDALQINRLLAEMVMEGCTYCFMEVRSAFDRSTPYCWIGICWWMFTEITHDHLDFHKTFDEYIKAKQVFFNRLPSRCLCTD